MKKIENKRDGEMKKQIKDKELFRLVDKFLYDTPERTKITMAWVSANCDVARKQALEEVEKVIDELEVRPELDEGTQFYPYIYTKELKSKIKEMEK